MPRTFQGRLTVAFVTVIALTLFLVTVLVLNRLDAWFTDQQKADLQVRSGAVAQYVALQAELASAGSPVVGLDNEVNPVVVEAMADPRVQHIIADYFGQADVRIEFGQLTTNGEASTFTPSADGTFLAPLRIAPTNGQTEEATTVDPYTVTGGTVWGPYAVRVTLSNPYTFRAQAIGNVTGLLAVIALFALGLSVLVSAWLARRFTTPLRQLTDAARGLAEGDLGRRVPMRQVRSGSS